MQPKELRKILESAEIRMTEAADLFHIARSTLYMWLADGVEPNSAYLYEHATNIASRIAKCTMEKKFPLVGVHGGDRLPIIKAVLKVA